MADAASAIALAAAAGNANDSSIQNLTSSKASGAQLREGDLRQDLDDIIGTRPDLAPLTGLGVVVQRSIVGTTGKTPNTNTRR